MTAVLRKTVRKVLEWSCANQEGKSKGLLTLGAMIGRDDLIDTPIVLFYRL